jgi:hypothetical protein
MWLLLLLTTSQNMQLMTRYIGSYEVRFYLVPSNDLDLRLRDVNDDQMIRNRVLQIIAIPVFDNMLGACPRMRKRSAS